MAQDNSKLASGVKQVNQQFKEEAVQRKAKELDMSYVNLLVFPVNSDLATIVTKGEAEAARAAIFSQVGKKLRVAVVDLDPKAQAFIEKLRKDGYWAEVSVASEESIEAAHKIYFTKQYKEQEKVDNTVEEKDLGSVADEISNLQDLKTKVESANYDVALNYIQVGAMKTHASDIHFQPEEKSVAVRFRVDGILQTVFELQPKTYDGVLKEVKYLSELKLNVTNIPQDGQYSFALSNRKINVRVSTLPTHYGEATVMRLLDAERASIPLEQLGYRKSDTNPLYLCRPSYNLSL